MKNRRNYYRILRVNPNASIKAIKDSYEALLQKLQNHSEPGSENWDIDIINQAYATLSDPVLRVQYDKQLLREYDNRFLSHSHSIPSTDEKLSTDVSRQSDEIDYYRVLHVPRYAEVAMITASYHALKKQPSANGNLLDEAWNILHDKEKRMIYDVDLQQQESADTSDKAEDTGTKTMVDSSQLKSRIPARARSAKHGSYEAVVTSFCLFCKTPFTRSHNIENAKHCTQCHSPLFSPSPALTEKPRRWLNRTQQSASIVFYEYWPGEKLVGNLLDLSPLGLRFSSNNLMEKGQIIKIDGDGFAAVAEISYCQIKNKSVHTGVRFIAISFDRQSGSFFSTSV